MKARALPVTDRVDRDGEAVVLVGRKVVRLSMLACAVVDACAEWRDLDALTEVLVTQFGEPPDGDVRSRTAAALTELRDQGLVELD